MIYDDMLSLAQRDGNTKRSWLLVNNHLGKHVPTDPKDFRGMCEPLATQLKDRFRNEILLLVGMAETATALTVGIATTCPNVLSIVTSTREKLNSVEFGTFKEPHSHAVKHKLCLSHIGEVLSDIDRIVLVDDEITTGNTLKNCVQMLKTKFPESTMKFAVVTPVNGTGSNELLPNVPIISILDTNKDSYSLGVSTENTTAVACAADVVTACNFTVIGARFFDTAYGFNSSLLTADSRDTAKHLLRQIEFSNRIKSVLLLGTEEYMYPCNFVADELPDTVVECKIHATTRSPISAIPKKPYPLYSRYNLPSLYDVDRITYVYNLEYYSMVIIFVNGKRFRNPDGLIALVNALQSVGNDNIYVCM